MRLAAALVMVAITWSLALYVHQRRPLGRVCAYTAPGSTGCTAYYGDLRPTHPSWQDPVAVFVAIGGLAWAAIIAKPRFTSL